MKRKLYILLCLLFLLLGKITTSCTIASKSNKNSLEAKVNKLFSEWDKPDSPGLALAVVKDGSVVYKQGYGLANLEYNIPITPSTIFHAASVSKQFTAFAVVLLAQQGKLSLDDDIRKHLSEVPDFGKTIRIRHLIHHISGLRDQWELLLMAGRRLDDVITQEDILKMVRHQRELNFAPGEEYLYCNTGFTLLAEIVASVTGQSFAEWTELNIFKPLGMTNTQFYDDHEKIVKNRAYSYSPLKNGGFKKRVLSFANVGATSLFTTVEDMSKWLNNFDDQRVGGKAVIEQMFEQGVLNDGKKISYAFGLVIGNHKGLKTVSHGGSDAGYRSHVVRFPEQNFAVIILGNRGALNPSRLSMLVADIYLADRIQPEKPKKKTEQKIAKVDPAVYETYTGKYWFQRGFFITITKENNRLMVKLTGQSKIELLPESETRFFIKKTGSQLTFHLNNVGQVIQLTFRQGNVDMSGEKFKPLVLDERKLAEYIGDYYSDELGTTYTIMVKNSKLIAQHRRYSDMLLNPTIEDRFEGPRWFFRRIHFTRNKENRVAGFRLTGGRVRNLSFVKQ